ncbi:hypothetical protein Q4I32_001990 [Leishmania shawi]|uniref:Uncharacterized protein n=2 Tax=Leishmania guyanensis species complex TaxID=38579 RepID=A0AAW3C1Y8_9TRYP
MRGCLKSRNICAGPSRHTRRRFGFGPVNHYIGRMSPNAARLCTLKGDFLYDSDRYVDNQRYDTPSLRQYDGGEGCQVVVPYVLDVSGIKYVCIGRLHGVTAALSTPKGRAFGVLYE